MNPQKANINISFGKGLDTKSDPKQIPIGNFASMNNSVFTKGGLLKKRTGYKNLTALPDDSSTYLTTFNRDLTSVGTSLEAYIEGPQEWVNKGNVQPLGVSVLPLVRNNNNQSQCDSVVASNGLVCTVYAEINYSDATLSVYKYVVADSTTGQNVTPPTIIPGALFLNQPKVYLLGMHFIVAYTGSGVDLRYIAISTANPATVTAPAVISASFTGFFDAALLGNSLYFFWAGSGGTGIKAAFLAQNLSLSSTHIVDAAHQATIMNVSSDPDNNLVWAFYWDAGTQNGYTLARDQNLSLILAATITISTTAVRQLTSAAQNSVLSVFWEVSNSYSYDANVFTDYIVTTTVHTSGVIASDVIMLRSVGIASKAFIYNGVVYLLVAYSSPYQPTYFLTSSTGNIIAKIAYQNGGGYVLGSLSSVTIIGTVASISYLFKDLIQAVNKNTNVPAGSQINGIYSQTGVNLVSFDFSSKIVSSEIGGNLNLSGGFVWAYDGYSPVEQGFFLYPDSVEVTTSTGVTPTGNTTISLFTVTSLSSTAFVAVGDTITGAGIPANTTIIAISGSTITLSNAATATASGVTLTIKGHIAASDYYYVATYEWSDNQGNNFRSAPSIPVHVTTTTATSSNTVFVPTLRLTHKTANPVKIVIYRWSTLQQSYYQVTSITSPVLNDLTIDSIAFVDQLSNADILGNNLLYTTGGVVENISPSAVSTLTLFDDRLWALSSEDPNLLLFSKQVIEATPVEMSDLFSMYFAPTVGSQGSTGQGRCIFPMDDKLIFFKDSALYYINGTGPDNTGANNQYSQPIFITSTVGCSNQASITLIPSGLIFEFASESGNQIWLLGRDLQTSYIGAPVEDLTNGALVTSAVNIPGTNQVRILLDNNTALTYDYFYGQWDSFSNLRAVSSTIYNGAHTYISSLGTVFQDTPQNYLDGTSPVLLSLKTGWLNLAGLQGYQRAFFFYLLGTYLSPFKLQCSIAYDYNDAPEHFALIEPTNFSPTYGGTESNGQNTVYGSDSPYGGPENVLNWRVFFKRQRCSAVQITLQEIYDPAFGVPAGAGFSLSGINLVYGIKSGFRPISATHSIGAK